MKVTHKEKIQSSVEIASELAACPTKLCASLWMAPMLTAGCTAGLQML